MAQDKFNGEHLDNVRNCALEADLTSNVWFELTAELARGGARGG